MSSDQHPYGKSENVLGFSKDNKVFVRDEPLRQMFLHPDVKHRRIVAFSIIGAYRKGKSFFLDYCLRFLYAHYPSINYQNNPVSNPTGWLGDENEPLSGFSWRSGTDRDTTGIVMWNDVFLHTVEESNEKIGIIVVDTHGLFDNETSSLDNSRIFTLDTLISSIQVFNLFGVIQDDHLQYLQFAVECAKFASNKETKKETKSFQNLMFLIRDWNNTEEFCYGIEGGKKYWEHFLRTSDGHKMDLVYTCESIFSSYEDVSCALFPHPGKAVRKEYNGSWGKIDEEYTEELVKLVDHLLRPEHLVVKKVDGNALNGEDFYNYVSNQFKRFQTNELLESQSIRDSMTKNEMEMLMNACIEHYKKVGGESRKNIEKEDEIPIVHAKSKEEAMKMFNETPKMGSIEEQERYRKILDRKIEDIYKNLIQQYENEMKRLETEKKKLEKEMKEKQRKELERIEQEIRAADEQRELEKQRSKEALEHENKLKEKELDELSQQLEQEYTEIRNRMEIARQAAADEIKGIQEKVEESKLEAKKRRDAQKESEVLGNQQLNWNQKKEILAENSCDSMEEFKVGKRHKVSNNVLPNFWETQNHDAKLKMKNFSLTTNNMNFDKQKMYTENKQSETDGMKSNDIKDLEYITRPQVTIARNEQFFSKKPKHDLHMKLESELNDEIMRNTSDSLQISTSTDNKQISSATIQSEHEQKYLEIGSSSKANDLSRAHINNVQSTSYSNKLFEIKNYQQNSTVGSKQYQDKSTLTDPIANLSDGSSSSIHKTHEQTSNTHDSTRYDQPIKFITYPKFGISSIDVPLLEKIFRNEIVKNRKIVAISIAGSDGEDKVKTMNCCLDFLYKSYPSLNHQNETTSNATGWIGYDEGLPSGISCGSISLEIWNDVFLHTAEDSKDDIAIILMNTHGLFDQNASSDNSLKVFLLGSLLSSIYVLNFPDFLGSDRKIYLKNANKMKSYNAPQNKGLFEYCTERAWNFLDCLDKGVFQNIFQMYKFLFLPNINQTTFIVFNSHTEEKTKDLLKHDKLIIKEVVGNAVTGWEFFEYIHLYCLTFQSQDLPKPESIYNLTLSKQFDIFVSRSIIHYNNYMTENQKLIKNDALIAELHILAKENAKNMLKDLFNKFKDYKSERDKRVKKLEEQLDNLFINEFKNQSNKNA